MSSSEDSLTSGQDSAPVKPHLCQTHANLIADVGMLKLGIDRKRVGGGYLTASRANLAQGLEQFEGLDGRAIAASTTI